MRMALAVLLIALCANAVATQRLSHGRFTDVTVYSPQSEVREFVLFLSGDGGWNQQMAGMAEALAQEGAMVAGISMPQLAANLEADGGNCVFPDGDLENLSHYVQAYYHLPTYHTPILVGYSSGATLAYAMIAQASRGTFAAALSLGFCPGITLGKPLCQGEGVHFRKRANGKGVDLLPAAKLSARWIALQGESDRVCNVDTTRAFITQVPGSELVMLPKIGAGHLLTETWLSQFKAAYRRLSSHHAQSQPRAPASLDDLPVVEVPATKSRGDTFAILLSGDGGWAGLDKQVAGALSAAGIPVAGIDSLRYFWTARTPKGLADDLDRVIRYYAAHWGKSRVLLVGYSQGADVLAFGVNRLPAASQRLVSRLILISPGQKATFEFHLTSWVGRDGDYPIAPEAAKLSLPTVCIHGSEEDDSLCPTLKLARVKVINLPGGHHYGGDYKQLVARILGH